MRYWRLSKKTGKFVSWKNGDWVRREDYEELLRETNMLKEVLSWKNFSLKFSQLLENDEDLDPHTKFALQIYLNGLQFLAASSKEQLKPKQIKEASKEDIS